MWRFPIGGYLFVADQRLETLDQHNIYGSDLFAEIGKEKKRNKGALTWRTCGGRVAADVAGGEVSSPAAMVGGAASVLCVGEGADDVRGVAAVQMVAAARLGEVPAGGNGRLEAVRRGELRREILRAWRRV
jgi:hypothetical protein